MRCLKRLALFLAFSAGSFSIPARAEEASPFTVGMILTLSGGAAEYGAATRSGVEMARRDKPELFSGMRWVYEDSRYDSNAAVSAFRRLTAGGGVDLVYVFGFFASRW